MAPAGMTTPRIGASLRMLGASFAFAIMSAGVKLASTHGVPLGQTVFYRGLVSLVLVLSYMRLTAVPFATPHWRAHLQRGIAGFCGMILYFGSITLLPLSTSITLNYTSPLLMAAVLLLRHRERPPLSVVAALLGGFVGIVLLLRPSYDGSQWFGALLALGSAVTTVIAALNIRFIGRLDEPVSRTVAYFSLFVTLGSLPWYVTTRPSHIDWMGIGLVAVVAIFSTLGQFLLTVAYQRGHTLLVSLLGYSQVIFTTLIGIALFNDHPGLGAWLAIALIIASGAAATVFVRGSGASAA
jgi:S-adenosylmethionine uptake transporter